MLLHAHGLPRLRRLARLHARRGCHLALWVRHLLCDRRRTRSGRGGRWLARHRSLHLLHGQMWLHRGCVRNRKRWRRLHGPCLRSTRGSLGILRLAFPVDMLIFFMPLLHSNYSLGQKILYKCVGLGILNYTGAIFHPNPSQ